MRRYIFCRPSGGLNDILNQIEKCCRYAEKTGRTVVVDTKTKSMSFKDDWSNYFYSKQFRLSLNPNDFDEKWEKLNVYPEELSGRLDSYDIEVRSGHDYIRHYFDARSGVKLTFDFGKDYPHSILLHHQEGGGHNGGWALMRMGLMRNLVHQLNNRLRIIDGSYSAVHIRHTDYTSDYKGALSTITQMPIKKLFLATDSLEVINYAQVNLNNLQLHSFAKFFSKNHEGVHTSSDLSEVQIRQRNTEAILDLITLAASQSLLLVPLNGAKGLGEYPQYSGFSHLAINLHENTLILDRLLEPACHPNSLNLIK